MTPLLFIEDLLNHRLLYPILIILVGAMSPSMCGKNIFKVGAVFNNMVINVAILALILITSLVDMPLALLWTFTYLLLWIWIWDAKMKRDIQYILESKKK